MTKLTELCTKIFFGNYIEKKYFSNRRKDYLYLTSKAINNDFISLEEDDYFYISKGTIQHHFNFEVSTLEYGDILINIQDIKNLSIALYSNEGNTINQNSNKVIISDNFLVLRPMSYLTNLLRDSNGRSYLERKLKNTIQKYRNSENLISKIYDTEISIETGLKVAKDRIAKTLEEKLKDQTVKKLRLDPSKISFTTVSISVFSLYRRIEGNRINLNTHFQRLENLWTVEAKSALIESLLINFPIPALYFDASDDNNWLIIDGLQRITSINQFFNNLFSLKSLEYLTELNDKKFEQLPSNLQSKLEEVNLTAIKILSGTPLRVKYSLFERINKEGKPLKAQEIRHAVNAFVPENSDIQESPSEYIKSLSKLKIFEDVWDNRKKLRMQDREIVLRYIAHKIIEPKNYSTLKEYLDEAMTKIYSISKQHREELKRAFADSLLLSIQILGEDPFINIEREEKENKKYFHPPVYDIWVYCFSFLNIDERAIIREQKDIFKAYYDNFLFSKDLEEFRFFDSLFDSNYYNEREALIKRITIFNNIIDMTLKDSQND